MTYFIFACLGLVICLIQWTTFNIKQKKQNVYTNEDIFFSKLFFNSWDWNINKYEDADDTLSLIFNETSTAIYEDLIKEKIKNRTKEEKIKLFIRRVIFISINVILIVIGVAAIFCINLYSTQIEENLPLPTSITGLFAPVVVSFVNIIIPALTMKITKMEKYDFKNTLLKQQIWRNFCIKLLNISIFYLLNYEVAYNRSFFTDSSIIEYDDGTYDCREDQAATNMARLVGTEVLFKFISAFLWMLFNFCKGGCGMKKGWRGEFPVSEEVVWLLYFHTAVWMALIWNPFVALMYPLVFYLMFKFIMFKLTHIQKKPLTSTNAQDIGNYIMIFFNISFLCIFIAIGVNMSEEVSHGTWVSNIRNHNCICVCIFC